MLYGKFHEKEKDQISGEAAALLIKVQNYFFPVDGEKGIGLSVKKLLDDYFSTL